MKILRAILLGILLWVLIFVEISIVQIGLKIEGLAGNIIHYLLLIPFVILCAVIYYKTKDKLNGFLLGVFLLIVGTILDLAITIPLFIEGDYSGFYSDIYLWIGIIEVIVITGIYKIVKN